MRTSAAAKRLAVRFDTKRSAEPDVVSESSPRYLESEDACMVSSDFSFREDENIRSRIAAGSEVRHEAQRRSEEKTLEAQRRPLRLVLRSPTKQNGQGRGS
jgi:hypothetical protein